MTKIALLAGACFLGLAVSPATAQPVSNGTGPADAAETGEIVVTAQKREQKLLDVPVAISAISTDTLINQNITSLSSYFSRVPGLQLAGARSSQISLRGITTGGASNPTIAILVDDVPFGSSTYLGNATIPDFDPATLQRIEVLRGPQGTLYGAASLGGLLKYVTKTPDTRQFFGRVEIGANKVDDGGYGHSIRGSVNVPILADRMALSLSGFLVENPQWIDYYASSGAVPATVAAASLSRNANKSKTWGGRAALFVKPFDGVTLNFSAMKQRRDTEGDAEGRNLLNVASVTDLRPVSTVPGVAPRGTLLPDRSTTTGIGLGRFNNELYTGRADIDLGFAKLTSVSAWGRSRLITSSDTTPVFGFLLPFYAAQGGQTTRLANNTELKKFSQEVRLGGEGPLVDWLVGGFYTKEKSDAPQIITVLNGSGSVAGTPYAGLNPSTYREISAFGDVTWHATNRLDIQVGARYADNKQNWSSTTVTEPQVVPIFGPSSVVPASSKDNAFTWLVTPSFKITPDMMIFARVATGYRPGGINTVLPGVPPTFDSDSVTSYELGLKGSAMDRAVTYDLALFQIDWKDIQLQSTNTANQFVYYVNAPKARSRGVEAQVSMRPWSGFTADANATYTDATLRANLPPNTLETTNLIGAKGDRLPYSAKFTGTLSLDQEIPLNDQLSGFVGGTVVYVGRRYGAFNNIAGAIRPSMPSYTSIDLRAGVSIDKAWRLSIYARNVTDRHGLLNLDSRGGSLARPQANFIQPRTVGFNVSGAF